MLFHALNKCSLTFLAGSVAFLEGTKLCVCLKSETGTE